MLWSLFRIEGIPPLILPWIGPLQRNRAIAPGGRLQRNRAIAPGGRYTILQESNTGGAREDCQKLSLSSWSQCPRQIGSHFPAGRGRLASLTEHAKARARTASAIARGKITSTYFPQASFHILSTMVPSRTGRQLPGAWSLPIMSPVPMFPECQEM